MFNSLDVQWFYIKCTSYAINLLTKCFRRFERNPHAGFISASVTKALNYEILTDRKHISEQKEFPLNRKTLLQMYIIILWGRVRATRSLHEEVPGIWFTSCFYSSLSSLLLLYFSSLLLLLTSSSIVAVLIAKAGHVWVSWPEDFLLYTLSLTL